MAKRFNETREKLSKEWQDEVVSFTKWMLNNPNLSLQQAEQKKLEIDKLYNSFKDMPLFIENEDL